MKFAGLVVIIMVSLAIDFMNLKRARKEKKVLILYALLMVLSFIIGIEIIYDLDILNPNQLIAQFVYHFF